MRYAVEYQLPSGSVGLVIFTATDLEAAHKYVDNLCSVYDFSHISNLRALPNGCSVPELTHLFPGYLPSKTKLQGKHQFRSPLQKPWSS